MFKRILRIQPPRSGYCLAPLIMGGQLIKAKALSAAVILIACGGTVLAADALQGAPPEQAMLCRQTQEKNDCEKNDCARPDHFADQPSLKIVSRQEPLTQEPPDHDDSDEDDGEDALTDSKPKPPPVPSAPGEKSTEEYRNQTPPVQKKTARESQLDQAPKSVPSIAEQRKTILDALFQRLAAARTRQEADDVLGAIEEVWSHSGSSTADLLMKRVIIAYSQDNYSLAGQLLNKLTLITPNWSEVWARSAVLRATEKDDIGAMRDIERALALEPRHIDMLVAAGNIFENAGDAKNALKMYARAHDLYPQHEKLGELIEKLKLQVSGRGI